MSLGRFYACHTLSKKLSMAALYGIEGIEIFYDDLANLADPPILANLLTAADQVHALCKNLGLAIICLQPFMHYEGLLDRARHEERISDMKTWITLAQALHTDLILIPSSFLPAHEISSDISLIVSDLQEVSELGLQQSPPIRLSYESLCWGTYIDKWEQSWDIVQRVDRPNFGLCLDTFNILGRIYADPASSTGCTVDAEEAVQHCIRNLISSLKHNVHKIFLLQLVSAERLTTPMSPSHSFHRPGQPARMSWSRNCRLFYGEAERGAYLPVKQVAEAIVKEIGYRGWVSAELFSRDMERPGEGVVEELSERASASWSRFMTDMNMGSILHGEEGFQEKRQRIDSVTENGVQGSSGRETGIGCYKN